MNDAELKACFIAWWRDSYPSAPNVHALMTHLGWGRHLLSVLTARAGEVTLAEAREAARQLAGQDASIVHRYLQQQQDRGIHE
jgi:hypothetical protein